MHYHCEIVLPPDTDIEAGVKAALAPFDENAREDDEDASPRNAFWDFYVIGGRWAGRKAMACYDKAKIDEFYAWCEAEKITVSGIQFGKQEISPASQIPKVDAKWNDLFPSPVFVACPLFNHSNDQFGKGLKGTIAGDVMRLGETPKSLECSRVIVVAPKYDGKLGPEFMVADSIWNGCNYEKTTWDGTLGNAIQQCIEKADGYREEYRAKRIPTDDWITVTVDYHS